MYGHTLPDGLRDNQALPAPIITPTSKAFDGGHDEPLTAQDIVSQGLLTKGPMGRGLCQSPRPLRPGQKMAAERGLILVDTKYEFGTDDSGSILLADEIHTPDSSRYWIASGYGAGLRKRHPPPQLRQGRDPRLGRRPLRSLQGPNP
jgi:phosphoribosylaminoimidazole-succinocarboxamide synthase